jgi:CubicO group peptidase (beta-lactamase class C family)
MKKISVLSFLLASVLVSAQKLEIEKINAIVNSKISINDPALFVGVVKDGKIVYENYRGLASLQHKVEIDENSRSNIASTAKQFTALMILDMALEEMLSLEDDVREHLPQLYPNVKEKIKIRHLLNHTSGIRDYADLMSIQLKPWWRQEGLDNDDVISLLEKQDDLGFKPGSRYMYSNSGYTLLTKIIANVTDEPFHDYSKKFFENLGMYSTAFLKNYMCVIPNQTLPYSDWGDGIWQQYPMMTNLFGDGFLFTTLKDQLIFEQAVQNAKYNNNVLLIESQKPIPNSEIKTYGFGLELEDRLNYKAVHHSGGTGSYHSQVVRYPDENLTVFVMSSNSRIWSGSIADEVASVFLPKKKNEDKYDNRISENSGLTKPEQIVGQYISPGEYLIRILEEKDGLYWRNGNNNPIEIIQERNNIYYIKRNPKMKIGFYENELVYFYPSEKANTYKKILAEKPTLSDLESYEGDYYSRELDVNFSIKLLEDKKLIISLDDWEKSHEVEVLNRNQILVFDYILEVQRDKFNRVTEILLTTNRVLNNRFVKKS